MLTEQDKDTIRMIVENGIDDVMAKIDEQVIDKVIERSLEKVLEYYMENKIRNYEPFKDEEYLRQSSLDFGDLPGFTRKDKEILKKAIEDDLGTTFNSEAVSKK